MKITITADDFGFSPDTVKATIQLLETGDVRNTSIMAVVPETQVALDYAASHPEHCYGVHLTFTRDGPERPLSDPGRISKLIDDEGRFFEGRSAQLRAASRRFPVDQVAVEMEAQLGRVADHGITIDYVDSHKHLHKYPPVSAALAQVLPRFGISRVRRPQNVYPVARYNSPTYWLGRTMGWGWLQRWDTTDYFYMSVGPEDLNFAAAISGAAEGTLEIGGHPGTVDGWRVGETAALRQLAATLREDECEMVAWSDM